MGRGRRERGNNRVYDSLSPGTGRGMGKTSPLKYINVGGSNTKTHTTDKQKINCPIGLIVPIIELNNGFIQDSIIILNMAKGYYSNDDAKKQLAVMNWPHSNVTSAPKIPDGALTHSMGLKSHGYDSDTFGASSEMFVLLWPGQSAFCGLYDTDLTDAPSKIVPNTAVSNQFLNGRNPATSVDPLNDNVLVSTVEPKTNVTVTTKTAAWRGVSYGINIKLLNNDNENSGSFTARRFNVPKSVDLWNIYLTGNAAGALAGTPRALHGTVPRLKDILKRVSPTVTAANNNSFVTGKLKDIGKHYFQLNDQAVGGHDMIRQDFDIGTSMVAMDVEGEYQLDPSAANNQPFSDQFLDDQFDMILIHMTGVAASNVAIDCVANREFQLNALDTRKSTESECAIDYNGYKKMQNSLRFKNRKGFRL